VLGAGDLTIKIGSFTLGGIGTATFGAIIFYHLMRDERAGEVAVADGAEGRPIQG
jgi:putative pyrimidine permease RutG